MKAGAWAIFKEIALVVFDLVRYGEFYGAPWLKECPSHEGACHGPFNIPGTVKACPTFFCWSCLQYQPWCFGGSDHVRCNACEARRNAIKK